MLATHLAAGPQVAHDRTRTRSSQLPGSGEERERPPRLRPPAYLSSSQSSSQRRVAAEWEFRASRLGWSTPKEFPSLGRRRAQSRLACSLPGPSPRASSVAESKEGWGFLRAPGIIELLTIALQHCNIFRTTHSSHHPRSKAINMSANCATWTSERIELLKRCLHAGLSCGQTAREIGVTRNAVIGKMNRLGLSRPKDVIGRQLEQRRAARLARPKTPRTWRSKRPRLNIFAQHEMLMVAFRRPQPPAEDIPIYNGRGCTLLESQPGEMPLADQQPGRRGLLLLRERTSQRIALLPGARAHCISAGRSAAQQRGCVSIPTTAAAPPRGAGKLHLPRCYWKQRALLCL